MNVDRFRPYLRQPGPIALGMVVLLALLMLVHWLMAPASLPEGRVDFLPPAQAQVPDAYVETPGRHGSVYDYNPNGMTLLPRTHWFARDSLFQHLPDGLADAAALASWRREQQVAMLYDPTTAFLGNCSGQCLPLTMVPPVAGEDLAVTSRDCLTQDQVANLIRGWSAWPIGAGLRVGRTVYVVEASFQVMPGTCPIGRWSAHVTERPYYASGLD